MNPDWKAWRTALRHPAALNCLRGVLLVFALFFAIKLLDPERSARLNLIYLALALAALGFAPLPSTVRLARGRLHFNAWSRHFYWLFIVPYGWVIGVCSAFVPDYAPLAFLIFAGGGAVGIGLFRPRDYWLNGFILSGIYFASLYYFNRAFFQGSYLTEAGLSLAAVLIVTHWMGRASEVYVNQTASVGHLLRVSRRDRRTIAEERRRSDELLRNILPDTVAEELKRTGAAAPQHFAAASVLFTDFEGFTRIAADLSPAELIQELDRCFSQFDVLIAEHNLEKLKTIGDSYMAVGGVPTPNSTHAIDCCLAALAIRDFTDALRVEKQGRGLPAWELRIGIHCGPLVAGVIGKKKFAYDVWGDTVNTASRCESAGSPGEINISSSVYESVREFFDCESRGFVPIKNRGELEMYYIRSIKRELSADGAGRKPNEQFMQLRRRMLASDE